jgi:iron(III) transport system permease protein
MPQEGPSARNIGTAMPGNDSIASPDPVSKMRAGLARRLAVAALIFILASLTLYPLIMLFYGSIHSTPPGTPGTFNLDGYRQVFTAFSLEVLANTVLISLVKTVLSLALAVALAWIVARTDTPWRGQLEVLITLPFFVPPILTAVAWGMLGNRQVGALNQLWRWLTGSDGYLINVYSFGGVVWHLMQYSTPFIFLLIVDAFRAMDPALEEAARMSGASKTAVLRTVTAPLLLPALTSGFLLAFMRGIESFESPLIFGTPAGIKVITTEIYDSITGQGMPNYQFATALSFVVMTLLSLLILLQWLVLRGRSFTTVTGKGFSPKVMKIGRWRWLTFALCLLFVAVTLVLPTGQLFLGSIFKFFGFYELDMLTVQHYEDVWSNDGIWAALKNTLWLALVGASATMVFGAIVAYVTTRTRWRGRRVIELLAWLPWLMPGIVLAIGFLWAFAFLPGPVQIYGTIWALLLAYFTLGTPLSVRVMSTAYAQISSDLEECSRVHGAGWWQTLGRILIALAWPAFAVGWLLALFAIIRELSASILLYSVNSEVLSVELMKLWVSGRTEDVSVIGLTLMSTVILFRWLQARYLNRRLSTLAV